MATRPPVANADRHARIVLAALVVAAVAVFAWLVAGLAAAAFS